MKDQFDFIIIGGGVVGSAIARELSRYELRIGVLEKNRDICYETSGRNSAVLHGGFAYDPGTLKAKFCVEGCLEFDKVSRELDFPFLRTGKVLVGNTNEDMAVLEKFIEIGKINGSKGIEIVDKKRLHELVPAALGEFALYSPYSGILETFQYTIALAENAVTNGVKYYLDHEVTGIQHGKGGHYTIETDHGTFITNWVINSAGLSCGKISEMLGITGYRIGYSKGDYIILDKKTGSLLPMPVYPVPSNTYMGIHVTPTIHGNVIVGPNAEYVNDSSYYGVSAKNIKLLADNASRLWPHIKKSDYIRNYSGILPKWLDEKGVIQDFRIELRDNAVPNTVNLIGIESPGLTAALPIARHVVKLIAEKISLKPKNNFNPERKGIIRFADQNDEIKAELISQNPPDYGEIICRCEKITRAEILQAVHNPLGADTMTGIKYRTRAMMGRCQGGYCQMRIAEIIEEELGKKETDILYARNGSNLFTGKVRT